MLAVSLSLEVGSFVNGKFDVIDYYSIEHNELVNSILNNYSVNNYTDNPANFARLVFCSSLGEDFQQAIVATFKRIKLKGKGSKWILTSN